MRRWLSLLLLVFMPLLSSWSVASAYCGDEPAGRTQHLGHHVDRHHDATPDASHDGQLAAADCDHCHSPGATLLQGGEVTPGAAPSARACCREVALRAPPVSLPDRPQWVRFA